MSAPPAPATAALVAQLHEWTTEIEGEHFEFKEARNHFSFEELAKYCCAFANEGGGRVVLGVTNLRPRRVVGTAAFAQPEETRKRLIDALRLSIGVLEIPHTAGRVLVFEVPAHPVGVPIKCDGKYWSREADSLVPMSEEKLRHIFAESGHDFSADVAPGATLANFDPAAIEDFRRRWMEKSGNGALATLSHEQLLRDAELLTEDGFTYAALVLFGTHATLGRFLAQAEVVFEWRSGEAPGPAQLRREYRQGFFSFYDDLWTTVNLRNDTQHYQDGLFVRDIPTFDERTVREAVLNAVSHRDYQLAGSVFVRQYARRLVIESPGGFPIGITAENVLDRQFPRNRRIATALALCGLVERSGQGMNLMFERSIRAGKAQPDFGGSDPYLVRLTLAGEVTHPAFVQYVERASAGRTEPFVTDDLLVLDLLQREEELPARLRHRIPFLLQAGLIESVGRGRGTRYLLSRRLYAALGQKGSYTRRRGLDRQANKELLVMHLRESGATGSPMSVLQQVLPALSRKHIGRLLKELRAENRVSLVSSRRWAKWVVLDVDSIGQNQDPSGSGGS